MADSHTREISDLSGQDLPDISSSQDDGTLSPAKCAILPKIWVANRYLQDLTSETLDAIILQNDPPSVFQRNGSLVRIKRVDTSKLTIEVLDKEMLIGVMARAALFVTEKEDPAFPPSRVASDILKMPSWEFPTLSGMVSAPVIRRDGSVLTLPGYDVASGLFYMPAPGLYVPPIKEWPTEEDAVAAAQYLLTEVWGDFPYVDGASRANALAALLTPLVRPVIDGCTPLFLFDKPAPGTGATLQTEIISEIVTGEPADLKKQSDNDEEMRKQITSWLLPGPQLIVIDNVDTSIRAPSLSSALTSRLWGDRILGHSKIVSLPNLATWCATGNNILLSGDMPRRACLISIDAKVAKPWERDVSEFKHPGILKWVRDNRGEVLGNALTMARAWFVAGKPKGSAKPLGSFENWTEVLSGMLEYAAVRGLLENSAELAERDSGADEWEPFFAKWHGIFGDGPILMRDLLDELWKDKELAEVMPEEIAEALRGPKTRGAGIRVGHALARKTGVTYSNGKRLVKGEDAHEGQKTWAVEER